MSAFNEDQAKVLSIIRMVTAPISVIASTTMIVMIARSAKKLSTPQNRLLLGLSVSDIISSFAMSFASLPMPKDAPNVWMPLGNTGTCEAQSFLFFLGGIATPSYNAGICIFFLLKVRYGVSDDKISTKVEPFLHGIPILTGLTFCVYSLIKEFFNPATSVCAVSDYPHHCTFNPNVPCERGEGVYGNWMVRCVIFLTGIVIPSVIFGTMTTLYLTVRLQEQRMARHGAGSLTSIRGNTSAGQPRRGSFSSAQRRRQPRRASSAQSQSKITMHRALAYSGAWLITYFFPAIEISQRVLTQIPPSYLILIVNAIFHPLQGFFNFLVFIHPKIISARLMCPEISLFHAICSASKTNLKMPFFRQKRRRSHSSISVRSAIDAVGNEEYGESVDSPRNSIEITTVKKESFDHGVAQIETVNSC